MWAAGQAARNLALFTGQIRPHLGDAAQGEVLEVSARYAAHLYAAVAAGWPLLQHAYRVAPAPNRASKRRISASIALSS